MHSRRTGTLDVVSFSPRLIKAVAIAAAALGVVSLGGCDRAPTTATLNVTNDIASAIPRINGTTKDRNDAEATLRKAINEKDADPAQLIYAHVLLAQVELKSAEQLQPQIDTNRDSLLARNWEIGQMAGALHSSAALTTSLNKLDPAPALAAVKKNINEAQGSTDAPDWVKTDAGSVPSLAAVTADISKLNEQITDLQSKLKQMNDQHTQLQTQADQLDQQSQQGKGDPAVAQFKHASDLRKQANDLTVQIDQTNVQLSRAQADLNVKTGQQAAINSAIADFGNVGSQIDTNWQAIQKQAEASTAQAKSMVGDATAAPDTDPTGGSTLSAKAARLQQLVDNDSKLRGQAESHVNSAIEFLNDAIKSASQLETSLKAKMGEPGLAEKPEVAAWKGIIEAVDPSRLRLHLANAQLRLANLYARQASILAARIQTRSLVTRAAEAAKVSLPDTLSPDPQLETGLTSARQSAATAYAAATESLGNISGGAASEADKEAAHQAAMYAFYQWSLLDEAAADAKSAKNHLATAIDERNAMSTPPTGLPPALVIVPKPAAAAPGMAAPAITPPG